MAKAKRKPAAVDQKTELLGILDSFSSLAGWKQLGQAAEYYNSHRELIHGVSREVADYWGDAIEPYRQWVCNLQCEYDRAGILLAEVAPDLVDLLPVVDFFDTDRPDSVSEIAAKVRKAAAKVREARTIIRNELEGKSERTADSKTDSKKKSLACVPENSAVAKLAKRIQREFRDGETKTGIALDFTEGDRKAADNLLRQVRRFKLL